MTGKNIKYTKEILAPLCKKANCVSDVIRALGKELSGGTHAHVKSRIIYFGIDISHFRKGHKPGTVFLSKRISHTDILVRLPAGSNKEKTHKLRRALLEIGRKQVCFSCPVSIEWNGKPLVLQIDHIDGDRLNNTADNLRFLCPNCHSQTDTFGSRNIN